MRKAKIYTSIALYDFTIEEYHIRQWTFYIIELFKKLSCPPNTIGISGQKKLKKFNPEKAKMDKYEWDLVEYMSFDGGGEAGTNENWIFHSSFDRKDGVFYFGFYDDFLKIEQFDIVKYITDIYHFCPFKYGIIYKRFLHHGPEFYSMGVIKSPFYDKISEKEEDLISSWLHTYMSKFKYKTGLLRDIYLMNFLCIDHLNMPCLGVSLQYWILSSEKHGTLIQLNEHIWQWSVPEENIPYVRETLRPTGFILCI